MPSKLTGLFKTLVWGDFGKPRAGAPPAPNTKATAAFTKAVPRFSNVNFNPVPGTKPAKFQLADSVTVDVKLDPSVYVMAWVFTHPDPAFQANVLNHEQKHYDIGGLLARDFFIAVMQLKPKVYSTTAAAKADFDQIKKDTIDKQGAIEKLYDAETEHGRKPAEQAVWDGYVNAAFTTPRPGGGSSPDGKTYKKTLVQVLKDAGKTL